MPTDPVREKRSPTAYAVICPNQCGDKISSMTAREMQRIFAEGDHYVAQLAEAERLVLEAAERWRACYGSWPRTDLQFTTESDLARAIDNWREVKRGGA
jgi:hypothetical protein